MEENPENNEYTISDVPRYNDSQNPIYVLMIFERPYLTVKLKKTRMIYDNVQMDCRRLNLKPYWYKPF